MGPFIKSWLLALTAGTLGPCTAFIVTPTVVKTAVIPYQPVRALSIPGIRQPPPSVAGGGVIEARLGTSWQDRVSWTALDAVREVTAEELEKEMTEWDQPMILDVFATWCGPCLMLKPELEKVAEVLDGKCRVLKLDSDDNSDMASALNVYGLPTVMYMKDGEMRHKTEGSMPAEEILQLADLHFFGGAPPADPADSLFIDTNSCKP